MKGTRPPVLLFAAAFLATAMAPVAAQAVSIHLVTSTRVDFGQAANFPSSIGSSSVSADGRLTVFSSVATNLVAEDFNASEDVFLYDAESETLERISVGSDGEELDSSSDRASISGDGRYVLFRTEADNAVPDLSRALVRLDRADGSLEPVILTADGVPFPEIGDRKHQLSFDGNLVVFQSGRRGIVPGDENANFDIFVRDMRTTETTRVSVDSAGGEGNGPSSEPVISGDGRFVAFLSAATNLVEGDTEGLTDVFLHDRASATTVRVTEFAGAGANGSLLRAPEIAGDGSAVFFLSNATNLSDPPSGGTRLWRYDIALGTLTTVPDLGFAENIAASGDGSLVSSTDFDALTIVPVDDGSQVLASYAEGIVGNFGRSSTHFVFRSRSRDLLPAEQLVGLDFENIYLAEIGQPPTIVSRATSGPHVGGMSNGIFGPVYLSSDARVGAFVSFSSTLSTEAPAGAGYLFDPGSLALTARPETIILGLSANGRWAVGQVGGGRSGSRDLQVIDLEDGSETEVPIPTVDSGLAQFNLRQSANPQISNDGQRILFASRSNNLVPNDGNFREDLFLLDRTAGPASRLQRLTQSAAGVGIDGFFFAAHLSADGSTVTFSSNASNLVPGDEDDDVDLFVFDEDNGLRRFRAPGGTEIDGAVEDGRLSGDGRLLAFESTGTNLTPEQGFGSDIYLADLASDTVERISAPPLLEAGVATGNARSPSISEDGRFVAFWTDSADFARNDQPGFDLVVYDREEDRYTVATINAAGESAAYRGPALLVPAALGVRSVPIRGEEERQELVVAFQSNATNLTADSLPDRATDLFLSVIPLPGEVIFANGFEGPLRTSKAQTCISSQEAPDPVLQQRRRAWAEEILALPASTLPPALRSKLRLQAHAIRDERSDAPCSSNG